MTEFDSYDSCLSRSRQIICIHTFKWRELNGTARKPVTGSRTRSSRFPSHSRQVRRCRAASNDHAALDDHELVCDCTVGGSRARTGPGPNCSPRADHDA